MSKNAERAKALVGAFKQAQGYEIPIWSKDSPYGELRTAITAALDEAERRGLERAAQHIEETWAPAYAEDLFTPVPKFDEQTLEQASLITRASFQMGNHLCKRIPESIRTLPLGEDERDRK